MKIKSNDRKRKKLNLLKISKNKRKNGRNFTIKRLKGGIKKSICVPKFNMLKGGASSGSGSGSGGEKQKFTERIEKLEALFNPIPEENKLNPAVVEAQNLIEQKKPFEPRHFAKIEEGLLRQLNMRAGFIVDKVKSKDSKESKENVTKQSNTRLSSANVSIDNEDSINLNGIFSISTILCDLTEHEMLEILEFYIEHRDDIKNKIEIPEVTKNNLKISFKPDTSLNKIYWETIEKTTTGNPSKGTIPVNSSTDTKIEDFFDEIINLSKRAYNIKCGDDEIGTILVQAGISPLEKCLPIIYLNESNLISDGNNYTFKIDNIYSWAIGEDNNYVVKLKKKESGNQFEIENSLIDNVKGKNITFNTSDGSQNSVFTALIKRLENDVLYMVSKNNNTESIPYRIKNEADKTRKRIKIETNKEGSINLNQDGSINLNIDENTQNISVPLTRENLHLLQNQGSIEGQPVGKLETPNVPKQRQKNQGGSIIDVINDMYQPFTPGTIRSDNFTFGFPSSSSINSVSTVPYDLVEDDDDGSISIRTGTSVSSKYRDINEGIDPSVDPSVDPSTSENSENLKNIIIKIRNQNGQELSSVTLENFNYNKFFILASLLDQVLDSYQDVLPRGSSSSAGSTLDRKQILQLITQQVCCYNNCSSHNKNPYDIIKTLYHGYIHEKGPTASAQSEEMINFIYCPVCKTTIYKKNNNNEIPKIIGPE